jgi:hypothetical protein
VSDRGAAVDFRISRAPATVRLAVALFVLLLFGFYATAQANLWVRDGGGSLPGPTAVLWKYHGRPGSSKLHQVLDPGLPASDAHAMWPFLDPDQAPATIESRRRQILGWVDAGAPESGWAAVAPIFTGPETCGSCHASGGRKEDLPFETLEGVRVVARQDDGMPWAALLTSAHNHVFAFAVAGLLLGLGMAGTGVRRGLQALLVLGAFGGAAIDVGCWVLTKAAGSPFHLGVVLGGALFGGSALAMAAALLDEAMLGGAGARRLGLARGSSASGGPPL